MRNEGRGRCIPKSGGPEVEGSEHRWLCLLAPGRPAVAPQEFFRPCARSGRPLHSRELTCRECTCYERTCKERTCKDGWTNRCPLRSISEKTRHKPVCNKEIKRLVSLMGFVHRPNGVGQPVLTLPQMRRIVNYGDGPALGPGVRPSGRVSPCPATARRRGLR